MEKNILNVGIVAVIAVKVVTETSVVYAGRVHQVTQWVAQIECLFL